VAGCVVAVVDAAVIKALLGFQTVEFVPGKVGVGAVFVGQARQAAKAVVVVAQGVAERVGAGDGVVYNVRGYPISFMSSIN